MGTLKISDELAERVRADRAAHPWRFEEYALNNPPKTEHAISLPDEKELTPISVFLLKVLGRARIRLTIKETCESPIEEDLATFLIERFRESIGSDNFAYCQHSDYRELPGKEALQVVIVPQWKFRGYRMDFALIFGQPRRAIFIECDGKEFHSTPEQLANDKAKDEEAASAGIPLLRFTGSELYRWDMGIFRLIQNAMAQEARNEK